MKYAGDDLRANVPAMSRPASSMAIADSPTPCSISVCRRAFPPDEELTARFNGRQTKELGEISGKFVLRLAVKAMACGQT